MVVQLAASGGCTCWWSKVVWEGCGLGGGDVHHLWVFGPGVLVKTAVLLDRSTRDENLSPLVISEHC